MQMTKADRRVILFWCTALPLLLLWWGFLRWMHTPHTVIPTIARLTNVVPLHGKTGDAARIAHAVRADDGMRTYMILVQDTTTARPTGGKIATVVMMRVENGHVISSTAYDPAALPSLSAEVSADVQTAIGLPDAINPLSIEESNWFADFPTSARIAAQLYRLHDPQTTVDAVFAVNAAAFDTVLAVTGPVRVGACTVRSGSAIVERRCVHDDDTTVRADAAFVGDVHRVLAEHVAATLSVWQKIDLLRAGVHMCDAKHLMTAPMTQMHIAAPLARRGWDGRVDTAWAKDYVLVDDGTLSPNGTDALLARTMMYDVDLSGSIPQAVVTMRYAYGKGAVPMSAQPLRTFVRVTTLRNTWFTSVTPCDVPAHYGIKYGRRYATCMVTVPYGSTVDVVFRYNLPIDLRNYYPYDLKVQHHAGIGVLPLTIQVHGFGARTDETHEIRLWRDMTLRRRGVQL